MSRASLLAIPSDRWARYAFDWEHAMAHRNALGVSSPLTRFSVVPYFITPFPDPIAATWLQSHQQAHNDAMNSLPSAFGSSQAGLAISANLIDWNLTDPQQVTTWTFVNHIEHYAGGNTILPATVAPPAPAPAPPPTPTPGVWSVGQWTYPFW